MSKRQPPLVRAGSGDSHEARLAVLEQRFSDEMQARCSWCNRVTSARQGEWLEIIISTPGTGVRPAHVFRCLGCEAAPVGAGGRLVAVPSGARRPGQSPPPLAQTPGATAAANAMPSAAAERSGKKSPSNSTGKSVKAQRRKDRAEGERLPADKPRKTGRPRDSTKLRGRPQPTVFPGNLSPAREF